MSDFVKAWNEVAQRAYANSLAKGFWTLGTTQFHPPLGGEVKAAIQAQKIALVHSEVSECLEAIRHGNPRDDKIPSFTGAEAELADAVIRIMDFATAYGWDVAGALEAKMAFNAGREHKHGKGF